jgi:hypothetical protein
LEYHQIGRDVLVFLANNKNPVTSLTTERYRDIYTGKIDNWQELDGTDQPIVEYQRNESPGSLALLRKFVVGKARMAPGLPEAVVAEMGQPIDLSRRGKRAGVLGLRRFFRGMAMPGAGLPGHAGSEGDAARWEIPHAGPITKQHSPHLPSGV